jgi:hypothetical protein
MAGVPLQEMMPFGAGNTPEGSDTALSMMVKALMGVPKKAVDAATGATPGLRREDYTDNPEAVQPNAPLYDAGARTAIDLAGVGTPMAASGAAGIFGGKLGVGADLGKLRKAEDMVANGMLPDDVRYSTGWHRSPADNLWRYEIPDNRSVMKYMPDVEGNKAIGSVESLFSHPDLFRAYPELRGQKLTLTKDSSRPTGSGLNATDKGELFVNAPDWRTARDVTLHELQHSVQRLEGFSPGADSRYYAQQIEKGLRKDPSWAGVYDFNQIKDEANKLYRGTAGEVEARNVQARKDMSPTRRESIHPWMTQDTPYLEQYHFDPIAETVRALRQQR